MERRFLLVDVSVLPEVFLKVLEAKELLAAGARAMFRRGENGRAFPQRLLQV
ncbi:MAG: hypothetical protein V8T36_08190 [Ruthenibacterium lactatiformans]